MNNSMLKAGTMGMLCLLLSWMSPFLLTAQQHLQCRITNVWTRRYDQSPDAGFSAIFFNAQN